MPCPVAASLTTASPAAVGEGAAPLTRPRGARTRTDDSLVLTQAVHDPPPWFGGAVLAVAGAAATAFAADSGQRIGQLTELASGADIVLNAYLVQTGRPGATARGLVRRLLPG